MTRTRDLRDSGRYTTSEFLDMFQTMVADLGPDEMVHLEMCVGESGVARLEAVLSDERACKIFSLQWLYSGVEDVSCIAPLLGNNCPGLTKLTIFLRHHSAFAFLAGVLVNPKCMIKTLHAHKSQGYDHQEFFSALGLSRVDDLAIACDHVRGFLNSLKEYLSKDLLKALELNLCNGDIPVLLPDAKLVRLDELSIGYGNIAATDGLSRISASVTKLTMHECAVVADHDWSFLRRCNLRELYVTCMRGMCMKAFGSALAVHLRTKVLDALACHGNADTNTLLDELGDEVGRIKHLSIGRLRCESIERIFSALRCPNNEMRKLFLTCDDRLVLTPDTLACMSSMLRQPNCMLAKFYVDTGISEMMTLRMTRKYWARCRMFVLLQVRRTLTRYCPLQRMPLELFRMLGAMML